MGLLVFRGVRNHSVTCTSPLRTVGSTVRLKKSIQSSQSREPALPEGCLHAHYLPHALRAAHGSWFGFCRAEGDLDASEERVVERFGAWLGMLETTNE